MNTKTTADLQEKGSTSFEVKRNFTVKDPRIRKENLHGTEWLVSPVVAVKEMVLDYKNDRHELLPFEEIENSEFLWEGMPVMIGHPQNKFDRPISGRSIEAKQNAQIGMLQNVQARNRKLKGEMWIDLSKKGVVDGAEEVINAINSGELIDVSTAYQAEVEKRNGTHEGDRFNGIQRNIRPDHLAVLPNKEGNCSIEDGCGAPRVNHELKTNSMKRNLLSQARIPSYDDTSSGQVPDDWPPNLEDFIEENDWEAEVWGDLTTQQQDEVVQTTLLGERDDTFAQSMMFPVVGADGTLQENALMAVLSGRGAQADISQSQLQSSRGIARNLLEEEFDRDLQENSMEDIDNEEVKGFYETIRNFFTNSDPEETDMDKDESQEEKTSEEEVSNSDKTEEKQNQHECDCQKQNDGGGDKIDEVLNEVQTLKQNQEQLKKENKELKEKLNKKEKQKREKIVEALNSSDRCPLNRDELEAMETSGLEKLDKEYNTNASTDRTAQAVGSNGVVKDNSAPDYPGIIRNNSEEKSN